MRVIISANIFTLPIITILALKGENSKKENIQPLFADTIMPKVAESFPKMVNNYDELYDLFNLKIEAPKNKGSVRGGKLITPLFTYEGKNGDTDQNFKELDIGKAYRKIQSIKLLQKGVVENANVNKVYSTLLGTPCDKSELKSRCFKPLSKITSFNSLSEYRAYRRLSKSHKE